MSSHSPQHRQEISNRSDAPLHSAVCLLFDAVLVIIFAMLGNRSHESGLGLAEVASTAGPFLGGLVLSWFLAFSWGNPSRIWPNGVFVVIGTVVLGMALRVIFTDGGVELSFVLVATGVLAVFLLGRRVLTGLFRRGSPAA